jgi:hypothetical protein
MRKEQAIMSIAQMLAQMDQGRSLGLANQAASMNPAQAQAYQATRNGGRPAMPYFPALPGSPDSTARMLGGVNRSGGRHGLRPMNNQRRQYSNSRFK